MSCKHCGHTFVAESIGRSVRKSTDEYEVGAIESDDPPVQVDRPVRCSDLSGVPGDPEHQVRLPGPSRDVQAMQSFVSANRPGRRTRCEPEPREDAPSTSQNHQFLSLFEGGLVRDTELEKLSNEHGQLLAEHQLLKDENSLTRPNTPATRPSIDRPSNNWAR